MPVDVVFLEPCFPAKAVWVDSLIKALEVADRLAPEHLSLQVRDPHACAERIRNAGALFLGGDAAEAFGDYGVGPNHVLPTAGASRYTSGLNVANFLRMRTWLSLADATQAGEDCRELARLEGLEAHARSVDLRMTERARG